VRKTERGEGKAKDLIEKFRKGELTSKGAYEELKGRGLVEHEHWEFIPWIIYFVLWLLPSISRVLKSDFLEFCAELQRFRFPTVVIYISIALVTIGIILLVWACRSHRIRGGLRKADETLILYKEGPYHIMRHPAVLGGMMWPILLPIILSRFVPFTVLSIAAISVMIVQLFFGVFIEEKLSIEKWGDEYRRYMKEVPGFNFILGLWRLRKQK
jgi:protein-S-isoprenylcysteine O-methyltransferase Ste14